MVRRPPSRDMRREQRIAVAGLVVMLAIAGSIVGLAWKQLPSVPSLHDPERVLRGARIYAQYCAQCHGARLEGQPDWRTRRADGGWPAPPHDDSGHTWHHANRTLFNIVRAGSPAAAGMPGAMPAFGEVLTDDQIWAVLAFIQSQWSERTRRAQQEIDRSAAGRRP